MGFGVIIVALTFSDRPGSYRVLKCVPNFSAHPLFDCQTKLIERSIRENLSQKATYAEMVKGTCSDVVDKVSAKISSIPQTVAGQSTSKDMKAFSEVFDTFLDKDKRKNNLVIQTEAERRRREAGVKQSMEIRVRSCMWVCMYGIWNYLANQGT